jgi:hypothetical protein
MYDVDTDRCRCGGEIVYYEDQGTHGCEVCGPWWGKGRKKTRPVDGFGVPYDEKKEKQ